MSAAAPIVLGTFASVPPWGWCIEQDPVAGDLHGYPTWDLRAHLATVDCPCRPELDAEGVLSHNSFDGRERYETAQAQPH